MSAKKYLLGAVAALPILLQPVHAQEIRSNTPAEAQVIVEAQTEPDQVRDQSATPDVTTEATPPVTAITAPKPHWSDTSDIREPEFGETYRKIMGDVPAPSDIEGWAEHARVLLAGGLFRESAGALERIASLTAGKELSPAQSRKMADIVSALRVMGVDPDLGEMVIDTAPSRSGGYFSRLEQLRSLARPDGAEVLAVASGLARQSTPVIRESIPALVDAARRSGDVGAARSLLEISMKTPGVEGSPLGYFINGELLHMEGKPEEAFLEYGKAAALRGEYAIRARLRIAELVLDEPGQRRDALANLQDLIATGLDEWRGDNLALLMLTRHAEVSERLNEAPSALKAMARILAEYPDQPQAELARVRSVRILAHQVDNLQSGPEELGSLVRLFRELEPAMSGLPGWPEARNMLAAKMADAGLTQMARAEYASILADLEAENPDNSPRDRARALEGLIRLYGPSERAEISEILKEFRSVVVDNPGLLSATLRVSGPDEFAILMDFTGESPYFTGDDHAEIGRINFEAGNMIAAAAAWERYISGGKTLSNDMLVRYYHAKSLAQKGLGSNEHRISNGEPDYLEDLLSASLKPSPDLTLFDGRVSATMLDDAQALAELVKIKVVSAPDAKNDKTDD